MRRFGLIGNPLDHSWSMSYFLEKFIREKITGCTYENFQLEDLTGLRSLINAVGNLSGLNITIPFKVEIIRHLDETDVRAFHAGAVNCIKISRSGNSLHLKGYNTDIDAFKESLLPHLSGNQTIRALVLGTGGAARAVCMALKEQDIAYTQVSRTAKEGVLTYDDLDRPVISSHKLIINATPAGMYPAETSRPLLPYKCLTSRHLLYDLIYNPEMTVFLKKGAEAGAKIKNGLEMLQRQAELSWKIWNNKEKSN